MSLSGAVGSHPKARWHSMAPIDWIIHSYRGSAECALGASLCSFLEAITSIGLSIRDCMGLVSWSMRPRIIDASSPLRTSRAVYAWEVSVRCSTRHPGSADSGGDRATRGRGMARNHACQHWRSRSVRHALDRGGRRSEVATRVRSGGRGGSASHEAITSAKARSSNSGSASTTARNSSRAATSDLCVTMAGHTETDWRSSAVAEITWESPAGDTAAARRWTR